TWSAPRTQSNSGFLSWVKIRPLSCKEFMPRFHPTRFVRLSLPLVLGRGEETTSSVATVSCSSTHLVLIPRTFFMWQRTIHWRLTRESSGLSSTTNTHWVLWGAAGRYFRPT